MQNTLTPTLNYTQLTQNISALQKGGAKTEDIQSYVNNYQKAADGSYVLKSAQPKTALDTGIDTSEANAAKGNYITGLPDRTAAEIGSGVNKIGDSIQMGAEDITKGTDAVKNGQYGKGALKVFQGAAESALGTITGVGKAVLAPVTALVSPVIQKSIDLLSSDTGQKVLKASFPTLSLAYDALSPTIKAEVAPKIEQLIKEHPNASTLTGDALQTALLFVGGGQISPEAKAAITDAISKDALTATKNTIVDTAGKPISDVVKNAGSTITGKTAEEIAAEQAKADLKKGVNSISPKLSPTEMNDALAAGTVKNDINPLTKKVTPDFTANQKLVDTYNAVKDIINPDGLASENLVKVQNNIQHIAENNVKPLLEKNPVPFNFKDLRDSIDLVDAPSSLKADSVGASAAERVKNQILDIAEKELRKPGSAASNLTDLNELWKPGKAIDKTIEKELGDILGTPQFNAVKSYTIEIRNQFRQFINDSLRFPGQLENINRMKTFLRDAPEGVLTSDKTALESAFGVEHTPYNDALAEQHSELMQNLAKHYDAVENLAPRSRLEQGTNAFTRWLKKNPAAQEALKSVKLGTVVGLGAHL